MKIKHLLRLRYGLCAIYLVNLYVDSFGMTFHERCYKCDSSILLQNNNIFIIVPPVCDLCEIKHVCQWDFLLQWTATETITFAVLNLFSVNMKLCIFIIHLPWDDAVGYNNSSWKTMNCLYFIINVMAMNDLAAQWSRTSAAMHSHNSTRIFWY